MRALRALALTAALVAIPTFAAAQSPEATAAYNEGLRFKRAKNHEAALGAFQRAIQLDPSYALAWTDAGNSQLALGQADAAAKSFAKALELNPGDQTARYNLAYTLRQLGRHADAAQQYQIYLERRPDDADAHYGLAESLKAAGKHLAAAEAYEAYARTEKRATWKSWIAKAREEAKALREKAKSQPPTAPAVSTTPAVAAAPAVSGGKAKNAPPAPQPAKSGMHLSFSRGVDAPPEPDLEDPAAKAEPSPEPVALEPTATLPVSSARPEAFTAGLERLKVGDYAAALVRLKVAASAAPNDSMILAAMAGAHLGLLQGAEAERAYRRALEGAAGPAIGAIHLGLGEALRVQGNDQAAAAEFRRAADHEASTPAVSKISRDRLAALQR